LSKELSSFLQNKIEEKMEIRKCENLQNRSEEWKMKIRKFEKKKKYRP
jgi:U3 small nucleolar ribonucleoprotein component